MWECKRKINRKAKKEHKCEECGKIINIKENYIYVSGISDGEPTSYKLCLECEELYKKAYKLKNVCASNICFGEVRQILKDYV
jgi:hypothetical protein